MIELQQSQVAAPVAGGGKAPPPKKGAETLPEVEAEPKFSCTILFELYENDRLITSTIGKNSVSLFAEQSL